MYENKDFHYYQLFDEYGKKILHVYIKLVLDSKIYKQKKKNLFLKNGNIASEEFKSKACYD